MLPTVVFKGKVVPLASALQLTTILDLRRALTAAAGIPPHQQRLIHNGKQLLDDSTPVADLAGKIMLVGTSSDAVHQVDQVEQEVAKEKSARGRRLEVSIAQRNAQATRRAPSSPYRFERIEALPALPDQDRARRILQSLADEPGVRAVMEKHQWTVGCLKEMYPEGLVGVSSVCTMGLNVNHGQEILLRLRTDDLRGFRKLQSIRQVLVSPPDSHQPTLTNRPSRACSAPPCPTLMQPQN